MANVQEIHAKLREKHALETDLLHWKQWQKQLNDKLPELKHASREASVARTEYENGGFQKFLHRLSGKYEETLETLRRGELNAANALSQAKREFGDLERQMTIAQEELQELNLWLEEQEEQIRQEPSLLELKKHLDAQLCARRMLPLLSQVTQELEGAADCIRNWTMQMNARYERDICLSRADAAAKECFCLLEQIRNCGILLEIHPYFTNPSGYIVGVARQFGELDRINSALAAIRETEKQAKELILQLNDE